MSGVKTRSMSDGAQEEALLEGGGSENGSLDSIPSEQRVASSVEREEECVEVTSEEATKASVEVRLVAMNERISEMEEWMKSCFRNIENLMNPLVEMANAQKEKEAQVQEIMKAAEVEEDGDSKKVVEASEVTDGEADVESVAEEQPKKKPTRTRKSLLRTELRDVELDNDDPGSSGASSSSESGKDDPGKGKKPVVKKKKRSEVKQTVNVLQTLSHKPPDVPKVTKLDDEGWKRLGEDYKTYKENCKRVGIEEKTIDHCIVNTEERNWRDIFRMGFLKQKPSDPDDFTAADVWKYIEQAKARAPEDTKDLCLKNLAEKVKGEYDLRIDTVAARIAILRAAVVRHLQDAQCFKFFELPQRGEADETKYARAVIVRAIVGSLKPYEFKESIKSQVENSNLRYDHLGVLELVEEEGTKWEHVHRKKKAVRLMEERPEKGSSQETVQAKAANVGRINKFPNAKCINCHQDGHWFLKWSKDKGEYIQNCPSACANFEKMKRETISLIEEKKLKRKQQHSTQRALIVDTDKKFTDLSKAVEAMAVGIQENQKFMQSIIAAMQVRATTGTTPVTTTSGVVRGPSQGISLLTRE